MKSLLLATILFGLVVGTALFRGLHEIAQAEHEDEVTTHVPVVLAVYTSGDLGFEIATIRPGGTPVPAIARQLVTAGRGTTRTPIAVCSESNYATDTRLAVEMWNDALGTIGDGIEPILEFKVGVTPDNCPTSRTYTTPGGMRTIAHWQPSSIAIRAGSCPGGGRFTTACAEPEFVRGDPWFTYAGRGTVTIDANYSNIPDKKKRVTIAHEIGHLLGFSHPYESRVEAQPHPLTITYWQILNCPGGFEYAPWEPHDTIPGLFQLNLDSKVGEVSLIAGLSKGDIDRIGAITEGEHGGSLMLPGSKCKGSEKTDSDNDEWVYVGDPALRDYDVDAYEAVYGPEAVANLRLGSALTPGSVLLTWDASGVHVEKGFDIQVRAEFLDTVPGVGVIESLDWKTVDTAPANSQSIEIPWPQDRLSATRPYRLVHTNATHATYRIVSVTDAFGSRAPAASASSAEVPHEAYTVTSQTKHIIISGANGGVSSVTQWYATITCQNGPTFTIGPAATSAQINADAYFALIVCYASGSQRASLDFSHTLTRGQIENAVRGTSPREEEMARTVQVSRSNSHGGSFSVSRDAAGEHAVIACDSGTTFTVGPAETQDQIVDDALFALTVCANAEELAGVDLSRPLTREQLETAILGALPPLRTLAELRAAPQGREVLGSAEARGNGHGFTIYSDTAWSWSGTCRWGGQPGGGPAADPDAARAAFLTFSRGCPTQVLGSTTTWRYSADATCSDGEFKTSIRGGYGTRDTAAEAAETWLGSACSN